MNLLNKIWKKSLATLIGAASLLTFSQAESTDCFDCCSFSVCDWDFTVGVDYLYWKACTSDLDYAVKINQNPFPIDGTTGDVEFDIKGICPDYESGYRVYFQGGSFCGNSMGIAGSYTQLNSKKKGSVTDSSASLLPTILHPYQEQYLSVTYPGVNLAYDSAEADWNSNYHEWTVGVTYTSNWKCNHRTGIYFGVAGMQFDEDFDALYEFRSTVEFDNISTYSNSHSDFSGWGVKLGTQYEYNICRCLDLFAQVNGTILVGDGENKRVFGFNTDDSENPLPTDYVFHKEDCCRVVPGYHLGLGANYETCICNVNLLFRVGYEFVGWFNLPYYRTYVEGLEEFDSFTDPRFLNMALSSSSATKDLSYHGLFAGVAISF